MFRISFIQAVFRDLMKKKHREIALIFRDFSLRFKELQKCAGKLGVPGSCGVGYPVARFISGPLHYRIAQRGTMERVTTHNSLEVAIRRISEKPAAPERFRIAACCSDMQERSPRDIHEEAERVLSERIVFRNAGAE